MSPKSHGRPKGRGRPLKKRQSRSARPVTVHEAVMADALSLIDAAHPVTVETAASQWLGMAWATARLGQRHPERDLVEALIGELRGPRDHAAYLALAALATIAAPGERDLIRSQLASSAPLVTAPWTDGATAAARTAWRASDAYGSVISIFVAYDGDEDDEDDHGYELAVNLSTVGGLWVEEIGLLESGTHVADGATGTITAAVEITPERALSEIAEALMVTDLYWPRQTDSGYVALRALAHARSRSFSVEQERESITVDQRHLLIEAFVAENDGVAAQDVMWELADTFIDFGDGYLAGGVLAWSPGEVEHFLTDWVVRKVILDAEGRAALPAVLRSWLVFALRRKGLQELEIGPVVAAVDQLEGEFRDAFDDESAWGAGKLLLTALQERGVDLDDKDAVDSAIREYNAEQLARRFQESEESHERLE